MLFVVHDPDAVRGVVFDDGASADQVVYGTDLIRLSRFRFYKHGPATPLKVHGKMLKAKCTQKHRKRRIHDAFHGWSRVSRFSQTVRPEIHVCAGSSLKTHMRLGPAITLR